MVPMPAAKERFLNFIAPEPNSGCWLWTGSLGVWGYGHFRCHPKTVRAHRFSYEQFVGSIPEGKEIDHKCRVRSCVNPDHLEAVSRLENIRRGTQGDVNRGKTHCPKGHAYDEANTRVYGGRRHCRACNRLRYHRAKREG